MNTTSCNERRSEQNKIKQNKGADCNVIYRIQTSVEESELKTRWEERDCVRSNRFLIARKIDSLSEMIDAKVFVSLESMQVNFNVTINAKTNEPVTQYEVDEKGMVQEVKSTFEQIEASRYTTRKDADS